MLSLKRILYVEDNPDSVELIKFLLGCEDENYVVSAAASAIEALHLMAETAFDLLIFDYKLPVMSGVELCLRVRETDRTTPILFYTAMARPADRALGLAAGADDYLVKPNDLDKLPKTVRNLLGRNSFIPSRQASVYKDRLW